MKKTILLLVSFSIAIFIQSQEIQQQLVSSSGDDYQTPNIHYSYSLGECISETYVAPNVVLGQGLHQLVCITVKTVNPRNMVNIKLKPNPAINELWLDISEEMENIDGLSVEIYDLSGKLMLKQKIIDYHQLLDISHIFRQTLIIRICKNNLELKSETIQRIY